MDEEKRRDREAEQIVKVAGGEIEGEEAERERQEEERKKEEQNKNEIEERDKIKHLITEGKILSSNNKLDDAIEVFERVLDLDRDNSDGLYLLNTTMDRKKKEEEEEKRKKIESLIKEGESFLIDNEVIQAIGVFERLVRFDPTNREGNELLQKAWAGKRRLEKVEAAKLKSRNTALWSGLAVIGALLLIVYFGYIKSESPQVPLESVFVKGGSFQMGDTFGDGQNDEKPVHEVMVGDFFIGKFEVTQGQWERVMGNNPSYFKKGVNYPVEKVSWDDVQEFIRKLNEMSGKRYRLPTEAEWEYAARSGGRKAKWAGTIYESGLGDYAWYDKNSDEQTHPVGQKKSNSLGLYDMSGNVWEWCQDWYGEDYYRNSPKSDPKGPTSGENRVLRGGAWSLRSLFVRVSTRSKGDPTRPFANVGFRLVLPFQ